MDRHAGRPSAPPYDGEGPHALWHYSEDPAIEPSLDDLRSSMAQIRVADQKRAAAQVLGRAG